MQSDNLNNPLSHEHSKIERQLERSGFFTHTALGLQSERINEIESFLYGVIDIMVEKGFIQPEELSKAADDVRKEMLAKGENANAGVGIRIDEPEKEEEFIPVNCNERMHICNAICCKLNFALSIEEIETGTVKWDLGKPYFIRHEATGYCTHLSTEKKCCSVYENRPSICRKYSCANDKRIWTDFDNMTLNKEWVDNYLSDEKILLREAYMQQ